MKQAEVLSIGDGAAGRTQPDHAQTGIWKGEMGTMQCGSSLS